MTNILAIMGALPALVKTIMELMRIAEEAFGAGKGSDKKQSVLEAVQAMVGSDDIWDKVKNLISGIINMIALFSFGSSGKEPAK